MFLAAGLGFARPCHPAPLAEGGGGWPTPYRTRWAAKHDAIMVCRWLGLPLYNEKASGTIVEVTL